MHAAAEPDRPQPIAVVGLWHLGSVIAACLADAGNHVIGIDPDRAVVEGLTTGHPPVSEPGLEDLVRANASRLQFTCDPRALAQARCAWVCFDTPVADDDVADVEWVLDQAVQLLAHLRPNTLVVVSSQLPVGSCARLGERCAAAAATPAATAAARSAVGPLRFACVPENLRLGRALESFREPDRIVAGVRDDADRQELAQLLAPFSSEVQWMRVESAEMTKHALNGFLATSVAFINEIAAICESVGADAEEVSRGLKSERRIGPRAYLGPGDAFAGGTLARDIGFLRGLAEREGLPAHVFAGVADGNAAHKHWTRRKLIELLGEREREREGEGEGEGANDNDSEGAGENTRGGAREALRDRRVAIWGLTYKPGTDTLRRSSAIELCRWLLAEGASVRAHDPAVSVLPADLAIEMQLCATALEAARDADVLVVCTAWPDYLEVSSEAVLSTMAHARAIDPAGALGATLGLHPDVRYVRVGTPSEYRASRGPAAVPAEEARR
jgi:UDPglucose 6-dehydrogenase